MLLDDEEIQEFVQANKAKNTVKKTQSDLRTWLRWCEAVGAISQKKTAVYIV